MNGTKAYRRPDVDVARLERAQTRLEQGVLRGLNTQAPASKERRYRNEHHLATPTLQSNLQITGRQ